MGTARADAAAAVLSDGRMLVAGSSGDINDVASVEVLAADGSGWATLEPMATARSNAVAGRLPGGQVIVAGGANVGNLLASAELWDPPTGTWAELPPMAEPRYSAAGCVLPSGRFAVLGGMDNVDNGASGNGMNSAEAFDPVSRAWQPLPPMPRGLQGGAVVAVAGGLLAVGGMDGLNNAPHADAMLFDEESGRWFTLPGGMPTGRRNHGLTTVPAP
jgi:hypothetical protein